MPLMVLRRSHTERPRRDRDSEPAASVERHNIRITRRDAAAMGVLNTSATFLPVFLVRLGGTPFEVGLVTSLPALVGIVLAIPIGHLLARRNRIVRIYSRARLAAHLSFLAIAAIVATSPTDSLIVPILVVWTVAAVPSTVGMVTFPIVMSGAAGRRGRYELMSLRWSILDLANAVSVVSIGVLLERLRFPTNYQIAFVTFAVAGVVSYAYARQFSVPDPPLGDASVMPARMTDRVVARVRSIWANREFVAFSSRHLVYALGARLILPIVPLYYVTVIGASDGAIGFIAMVQSLALLFGFVIWRRMARNGQGPSLLLVPMTLAALFPLALAFTGELPVAVCLVAVAGFSTAGVELALFETLMRTVPMKAGVVFTSVDHAVMSGASVIAPLVGAVLAEAGGLSVALQMGTVVSLAGLTLFALAALQGPRPARAQVAMRVKTRIADPVLGTDDDTAASQ